MEQITENRIQNIEIIYKNYLFASVDSNVLFEGRFLEPLFQCCLSGSSCCFNPTSVHVRSLTQSHAYLPKLAHLKALT